MVRITQSFVALAAFVGLVAAYPVRREVPQEHSHEAVLRITNTFLKKDNPDGIVDAVFSLLGNAAASQGQGKFPDTDCLQTGVADRAFTNAKAANDIEGMTNALIFRAIERNTGKVGLASVACTAFTPVNPEIAALSQHQDPASAGAAAINKGITLELARQIASIGGNPLDALKSGTFAPGDLNDATAKGNTCDDANDAIGCIISQNLLVEDATADEINTAVAGAGGNNNNNNGNNNQNDNSNTGNNNNANAGTGSSNNQNTGTCEVDGGAAAPPANDNVDDGSDNQDDGADDGTDDNVDDSCPAAATVTVTVTAAPTATAAPTSSAADSSSAAATTSAATPPAATGSVEPVNTGNLKFGSCTNPSVTFGAGLDNRKATEFSFLPADLTEFNHGSALNPQIIFQSNCDTLVNKCGLTNADDIVKTCRQGQQDAAAFGKDGKAADVFNAALGFTSNFASVDTTAPAAQQSVVDKDASGTLTFRNCATAPTVKFGAGFEGRAATEFTFLPLNAADYPHGSAKNIDIILRSNCDTLVNKCGFTNDDATVKLCRQTETDVASLGFTGKAADTFNAAFGVKTDFAALDQ
jgi:hypothetical protein